MRITVPIAVGIVAAVIYAQTPAASVRHYSVLDASQAELVREFKDLSTVQFAADQSRLPDLLRTTSQHTAEILSRTDTASAIEEVHTMRFETTGGFDSDQRSLFRYTLRTNTGSCEEHHSGLRGESVETPPTDFTGALRYFLPEYQKRVRFRDLGSDTPRAHVIAFAEAANPRSFQGLAWIDVDGGVARIRLEQLRTEGFHITITDIRFDPSLRPSKVTVSARSNDGETYAVHRFSDYQPGDRITTSPPPAPINDLDARETLVNGIVFLRNHKPQDAIAVLIRAVALDGDAAEPHYQLGVALHDTHDLAGAEAQLREVVKRAPGIGMGHNELGTVMFERGDTAGAAVQFREAARLDPKDASAHANAGEALLKAGDRPGAIEEYRIAASLLPGNAAVKARYEALQHPETVKSSDSAPNVSAETTIRVDVRQVLVPVIVTDRSAHRVTDLRQTDFLVFEDGVEQSISGFTVDHTGSTVIPEREVSTQQTANSLTPARPVTSYLICVDTLHASFGNFGRVREALVKIFEREHPGTAQYSLVTLGNQPQILQQFTVDPSVILAALDARTFMAKITSSQRSSDSITHEDFRRSVETTRRSCDSSDPLERAKCDAGKRRLSLEAEVFAQRGTISTIAFLRQLRALIEQMARMPGRRTMVLLSDGFLLSPSRESFGLLASYFPEMREAGLHSTDRLQSDFDPLVRLATRHNVPIDSIDSRGLYAPAAFDASSHGSSGSPGAISHGDDVARESGNSLAELAAATGGIFLHNTNDVVKGIEKVLADGRDYYVLSYIPKNGTPDSKFRAITVKVRDDKLTVRAKRGYWATEN